MKTIILSEILLIFVVILSTFIGIYYFLHNLFGVTNTSIIILFIPTVIPTCLAAAYGYALAVKKHYAKNSVEHNLVSKRLMPLFFLCFLSLICFVGGLYLSLGFQVYIIGIPLILGSSLLAFFLLKKLYSLFSKTNPSRT